MEGAPSAGGEGSHRLAGTASAGGREKLTAPADAAYGQPFSTSIQTTLSFLFNNILASPRLSRNQFVFINISGSIVFHFLCPFVFIHISGSTFIFNIFLGDSRFLDFCHEFLINPAHRGSLKTRHRPRRP